jgi:hypothetical protein
LAGDGDHTVEEEMEDVDCKGLHRIEVRDKNGDTRKATLELRYRRIRILPPLAKLEFPRFSGQVEVCNLMMAVWNTSVQS